MDPTGFLCHHLVLFLCFPIVSIAFTNNITTDQTALLALKSHLISGTNSSLLLANWTSQNSVCSWAGMKCSPRHGRIVALNISNLGLTGTIPPQLGNLSFLISIDFSSNHFHGNLPPELGNLRRLRYINFSLNNFRGKFPSWIGSLPNLQYLNLGNNTFAGLIPGSMFNATRLETLVFRFNHLEGNIPQEVGNLGNLKILDMQYNQLTGSIPLSILNITSLQTMAFTENRLSGYLPLNICPILPKLRGIHLSVNQLSGRIESRFDNCSELQILSLSVNNFSGLIPREIGNLSLLHSLTLGFNNVEGEVPPEFGNLRNLELLNIGYAFLSGPIPAGIGNLQKLTVLNLNVNALSGPIPASIFNVSSLSTISLSANNFFGSLPLTIGLQLPNLENLLLGSNKLSGVVLDSISNLTKLVVLDLGHNKFSGPIPPSLGDLRWLEYLILQDNLFTSDSSSPELSFLATLTNSRSLRRLAIGLNPLNGTLLPTTIGNFSNSLQIFSADSCGFRGNIPNEIGNLTSLSQLDLWSNDLTGPLPVTFQKLSNLQALYLSGNKMTGIIPSYICNLSHLSGLLLNGNRFLGPVPECVGNMTSLRYLYLHSNILNSTLPGSIGSLIDLLYLDIHGNYLSGYIPPEIGNMKAAISIDLSDNEFSGNIPTSFGGLGNLINLSVAQNQLEGLIPETCGKMLSLESLDLSRNNLTGEIPTSLESLLQLKYFNVSFNHLHGKIPINGSFQNLTDESSFISNYGLCGGAPQLHFPPCAVDSSIQSSRKKRLHIVSIVLIPTALVIFVICGLLLFLKKQKRNTRPTQVDDLVPLTMHERIPYHELQHATNGFSESNLLAAGSFGRVYVGLLRDGTALAIKVFNLELEGALKSFERECEVLCNIRHRNLVKVISSCSNLDFKALVLEYMPNGSLERWLYSHNNFLDFPRRLDIVIDVASALDYLHHGLSSPIVHCDLKPSNVLLDQRMVGHVSDFGMSRLFGEGQNMEVTKTLATIGYIAPEYGSNGVVTTSCDVYSFGILLMETFSRKKPTDEMFTEVWGLKEWIRSSVRNSQTDFVDQNLLDPKDQNAKVTAQCIITVMDLALSCVVDPPEQRTDPRDALEALRKTKLFFLSNVKTKG